MLAGLGIAGKIIPLGLVSPKYHFRDRVTGELVAEFDLALLRDEVPYPFVLQYEQYKLTGDIASAYADAGDFDVRFSTCVTAIEHGADEVVVGAEGPDGREQHRAAYVIGADGGRSTVRKAVGIDFEGFTYPERFIKIATPYDFQLEHPDYVYRNYFSDPDEWCNLFKVTGKRARAVARHFPDAGRGDRGAGA